MNTTRQLLTTTLLVLTMLVLPSIGRTATPVRVTEIHSEHSPLISFRIIIRVGSINDPAGKEGLNALTAQMIGQGGTRDLPYQQVVAMMYPWAASFYVQPEKEITTFVGQVHRDHLDKFYALMSSLLLAPRFDPDDFTRNKDLALSALEKNLRGTDDENLGKEALGVSLFEHHPYGTADATVQGLTSITLDDVKAYYKKAYTTGNTWVGIAGGYPASLVQRVRKDFGTLPDGKFSPVPLPKPEPINGLEISFVRKPARATAISIGHPLDVTRKDRDFYALMVANSYFGEHRTFNGVLMNSIRGDRGLNYGDYSYIERFIGGVNSGSRFPDVNTPLRQQYFSIWIRPVEPSTAHFAFRAAMFELQRLVKDGLTREQFEQTRKFLLNYSKLWAQTLDRRLGYRMDSEFYGTEDYIGRIEKELSTLTVEDVNRAIRKHLSATNLKAAVVANDADSLMAEFLSNAPSPVTYNAPVSDKVKQDDAIINGFPLRINAARTRLIPVEQLFENESPGTMLKRKDKENSR